MPCPLAGLSSLVKHNPYDFYDCSFYPSSTACSFCGQSPRRIRPRPSSAGQAYRSPSQIVCKSHSFRICFNGYSRVQTDSVGQRHALLHPSIKKSGKRLFAQSLPLPSVLDHLYRRFGFTAVIASLTALAYLLRLLLWHFIRVSSRGFVRGPLPYFNKSFFRSSACGSVSQTRAVQPLFSFGPQSLQDILIPYRFGHSALH